MQVKGSAPNIKFFMTIRSLIATRLLKTCFTDAINFVKVPIIII